MNRKDGYYWVKMFRGVEWWIAKWHCKLGYWTTMQETNLDDDDFYKIDENRIERER